MLIEILLVLPVCTACWESGSLRSRRKRGKGRGARTREKNGVLGGRDEGTRSLVPRPQSPIFLPRSSSPSPSPSPFTPATQARKVASAV